MEKINSTEAMLVGIIEQVDSQGKQIALISKTMEQMANDVGLLVEAQDSQPVQQEVQSVITLKDHEEKIKTIKANMQKLYEQYVSLQKKYEKLRNDKRYWATQQWAKHLFRWLFVKRHLWIWLVYFIFNVIFLLLMNTCSRQRAEIDRYKESDIKYRYLQAMGIAHETTQALDSTFTKGDSHAIQRIYSTVDSYEKAQKHKSDSIVRAEQKKMELLR
jgi:hypothetical protein